MSRLRISRQALCRSVAPIRVHARIRWTLLLCLCALPVLAWADPVLPHILGDHMVLQRDRPHHIWGKADPKEKITVELAGETSSTEADVNGKWSVDLPSMRAGGPFT